MVERKFKKWQLAFIVGLIFIIPVILVFQFTNADIELRPQDSIQGCGSTPTTCQYVTNGALGFDPIMITERDDKWLLRGNCVDTKGESLARALAIADRDGINLDISFPSNPDECLDSVIFLKKDWDRSLEFTEVIELNTFTLKEVGLPDETPMNLIGG